MIPSDLLMLLVVPLLAMGLVGTGYWLGRIVPVSQSAPRRRPAEARRAEPRTPPAGREPRHGAPPETNERLRHDIASRVQAMRQVRAPVATAAAASSLLAIDAPVATPIETSPSEAVFASWFADTAIEPHTPSRTH